MTLKIRLSGTNKRFVLPPTTFVNGTKVRFAKVVSFINGEKVQLWGNTRCELINTNATLMFNDYKYPYISENAVGIFGNIDGTANEFGLVDISNQNGNFITKDSWGSGIIFSPNESTNNNYIYYLSKINVVNKMQITNNTTSIVSTYSLSLNIAGYTHTLLWSVQLPNNKKLWFARRPVYASSGGRLPVTPSPHVIGYKYAYGYDTTVIFSESSVLLSTPYFNDDNFVICTNGNNIVKADDTGYSVITTAIGTITSFMLNDDDITYTENGNRSRFSCCDINGTENWHIDFDSTRNVKLLGMSGDYYYLLDMPATTDVQDQNVYIRKYYYQTGAESNVVSGIYRDSNDTRIVDWNTFPIKTKNNLLVAGSQSYILKVFTD